uniref:MST1 n=1 Tax=Arundo donax TaxID=35708 RepID=A0A0A8Z8D1_ARUDO
MMFQFMMDLGQNGKHNQILITQKLLPLLKITNSEFLMDTVIASEVLSLDC